MVHPAYRTVYLLPKSTRVPAWKSIDIAQKEPKMPARRKRQRDVAQVTVPPSASTISTASLAERSSVDAPPAAWRAAASAEGVSGTDAFLCHLGRSVLNAIRSLQSSSEAARAQLRATRASLIAAVNSRCDELEELVTAAESAKLAALERELCAIDIALELWRVERSAVAEAAANRDAEALAARHVELTARLDAMETQVYALRTSVLEIPHVGLVVEMPELLDSITSSGRLLSPRSVTIADLALDGLPRFVRPGESLCFRLVLESVEHASQAPDELRMSLGAAAASTSVEAVLETPGASLLLSCNIVVDVPNRSICVAFDIPSTVSTGSVVRVGSVTVYGECFSGAGLDEPLRVPVRRGVQAPLRLVAGFSHRPSSLCISACGRIYMSMFESPDVLVFDSDGVPEHGIPLSRVGLDQATYVAFAEGDCPTLFISEGSRFPVDTFSRIAAVDPVAGTVRWTVSSESPRSYTAIAALPNHNIVVALHGFSSDLFALRLTDGAVIEHVSSPGLCGSDLAVDPSSGMIFGNVIIPGEKFVIGHYVWDSFSGFRSEGAVAALGELEYGCPLAVVPPAPGKRVSHLVVCDFGGSDLRILALPGLAIVHSHTVQGLEVMDLAADPWGEGLAVNDQVSSAVFVLAWPLPGMPTLE